MAKPEDNEKAATNALPKAAEKSAAPPSLSAETPEWAIAHLAEFGKRSLEKIHADLREKQMQLEHALDQLAAERLHSSALRQTIEASTESLSAIEKTYLSLKNQLLERAEYAQRLHEQAEASHAEAVSLRSQLDEAREQAAEKAALIVDVERLSKELEASRVVLREGQLEIQRLAEEQDAARTELAAARVDLNAKLAEREAAFVAERDRLYVALAAAEATAVEALSEKDRLSQAHRAALAASERRAEEEARLLKSQLIAAEARLAKVGRPAGVGWLRLLSGGGRRGEARLLKRSGLFDEEWYRQQYRAVANGGSFVEHFLEEGYLIGCKPNPFFDPRWYLERYEDVRRSGINPTIHYFLHGAREGRDPGPNFRTAYYLSTNSDVRDAGDNPLAHYLTHGRYEGRAAIPPPDTVLQEDVACVRGPIELTERMHIGGITSQGSQPVARVGDRSLR